MRFFRPLGCLVLLLLIPAAAHAQEPGAQTQDRIGAPNAIFFELLGNGLLYTINYDRRLRDKMSVRIGFMYAAASGTTETGETAEVDLALFPLLLNGLLGGGSHRFELGIGPMLGGASGSGTTVEGAEVDFSGFGIAGVTSTFGYRYQPLDGGFVFRIGLTPFVSGEPGLWAGISLGYAF